MSHLPTSADCTNSPLPGTAATRHSHKGKLLGSVRMAATASLVLAATVWGAGAALAAEKAEGQGNTCPWATDATVTVAGHDMVVPQAVFDPRTPQMNIDGYEVVPALHQLTLRFFGPWGDVWESLLTRIDGGKRCVAFLVASPVQTAEALPYSKRKPLASTGRTATAVVADPTVKR